MDATGQHMTASPPIQVAIGLIFDGRWERLLIAQRTRAPLRGYWEFPGGKCQPGESAPAALHREVAEEVGLTVEIVRSLPGIVHRYRHGAVEIFPFICQEISGEARGREGQAICWAAPGELARYDFPEANAGLLENLRAGNWAALAGLPPRDR